MAVTISGSDGGAVVTTSTQKVLQVVNVQDGAVATGTTVIPHDNTTPQNTEGNEYMTLAITPTNASSKLRIDVNANITHTGQTWGAMALFQDSTASALATASSFTSTANGAIQLTLTHYMTAGSTSSTTFKIRIGGNTSGTTTFNGAASTAYYNNTLASSITITEIET